MTSKNFTFQLALCISLVLISGGKSENEEPNTYQHSQESYLSSEVTLNAAPKSKRWFGIGFRRTNNNFRKAVDEQQKIDLELALETIRLEELEKLMEDEKISDTTPNAKLNLWQVKLLKDIKKSKTRKEDLTVKAAMSSAKVDQLTMASDNNIKSEGQIKDRTNKLIKALADQSKVNLELALASKKLEELQKQKESEQIDISIAPSKLTRWQRNLLSNIVTAKEKKGYLTVGAAVMATKVDRLKQQLTEVGGMPDDVIASTLNKAKKQINEKLYKAEINLAKINMDLKMATTKLEQLEQQRKDEVVYDKNSKTKLNRKYKVLLDVIEKTKEKKYDLTLKAALEEQVIDQLKLELNPNEKTSTE